MSIFGIFHIGKRTKPDNKMPEPLPQDNWMEDLFQKNIKAGVKAMQSHKAVTIHDDGRGYELALQIKQQFILEYTRQLAEKICIEKGSSTIHISLKP